jgi:hypothetical protein
VNGDYVKRLRAFLDAREARGGAWRGTISVAHGDGARTGEGPGMYRRPLTDVDLRAALDELEQLRAQRTFLDGQVFISGWHAHAEACQAPGWTAREAAWRKYREEMAATLAKAETVPQQPEPERFADECDCECQPGQPCLCPERDCYCGPCRVCGENPQRRAGDA